MTSEYRKTSMNRRAASLHIAGKLVLTTVLMVTGLTGPIPSAGARPAAISSAGPTSTPPGAAAALPAKVAPVYAYYYLWWSRAHWLEMLGPNFPATATPLPLPATLDPTGCHPISKYVGNRLTDVPSALFSQDDLGQLEADVRQAAAAGLAGFAVNWAGNGSASQTVDSTVYSRRLQKMVDAVHRVNAQGIPFKLWLSYKASAKVLTSGAILGDLDYFAGHYASDSAFDHSGSVKPTVIWQGSRKYTLTVLQSITEAFGGRLRILGDESAWTAARSSLLDGDAYYWSSQDPVRNPQSFAQLATLAAQVHGSPVNRDGTAKVWVAPAAPGYDKILAGGSACVPRLGGQTLRSLFKGNAATGPAAWGLISWNEVTEGTYLDPMTRYGNQGLDVLAGIIANGP